MNLRRKAVAAAIAGAVALGGGVGYFSIASASAQVASARTAARAQPAVGPMMGVGSGSTLGAAAAAMMSQAMDAAHAQMLRKPAVREWHQAIVREHQLMHRDTAMGRVYQQTVKASPVMATMMRDYMGG